MSQVLKEMRETDNTNLSVTLKDSEEIKAVLVE